MEKMRSWKLLSWKMIWKSIVLSNSMCPILRYSIHVHSKRSVNANTYRIIIFDDNYLYPSKNGYNFASLLNAFFHVA